MPTFYIPTDIPGGTILVNEGDVFIFESDADDNVTFESASGNSTTFAIQFNESNANGFDVEFKADVNPQITIADDVALPGAFIKGKSAESIELTAGNNVTLDKYEGSSSGSDTVVLGDNFVTNNTFKLDGGDDALTIGENATGSFDAGGGNDTIVTRDPNASISNAETVLQPDGIVDGTAGDDVMGAGYSDGETDASGAGDDILRGYAGNDTMDGGAGNDLLEGGDGNDSVIGGDGSDTLWGGRDRDTLLGGTGDDVFLAYASDGDNSFFGGDGSDTILAMVDGANIGIDGNFGASNSIEVIDANGFADVSIYSVDLDAAFLDFSGTTLINIVGIYGEGNNDTIIGSLAADFIYGGTGDDSLDGGAGADTFGIEDGFGSDTILGGEGGIDVDTIDLTALSNAVDVTFSGDEAGTITDGVGTINFSGIERILFTELDDIADASATTTGLEIATGGGADSVLGGAGADTISGDSGSDTILAGDGADSIQGGTGDDSLEGGSGNDTLLGGNDVVTNANRVALKWSDIPDPNDGGQIDQNDQIASGTQSVNGVDVTYSMPAGIGRFENATQYTAGIDDGTETINANSAVDLFDTGLFEVDFSEPVENVAFRINNFDSSNENLVIRAFDALGNRITINATTGSNVLASDNDTVAGDETFEGAGGEFNDDDPQGSLLVQIPGPVERIELDFTSISNWTVAFTDFYFDDPASVVVAEAGGNDTLIGGDGHDLIEGNSGDDSLLGGSGNDTISGGDGSDYIDGGDGDDLLTTGLGNDTLLGGEGNDTLMNSAGDDSLVGGTGNDSIVATLGNDTLEGGEGDDTLEGGVGDDSLDGGSGADLLSADVGDDTVFGGAGDDTILGGIAGAPEYQNVANGDAVTGTTGRNYYRWLAETGSAATITLDDGAGTNTDGDGAADYILVDTTNDTGILTVEGFDYGVDMIVLQEPYSSWQAFDRGDYYEAILTYTNGNTQQFFIYTDNPFFGVAHVFTTEVPIVGDDSLSGGDDSDSFIIEDGFGNDTIDGGAGGNDDDLLDFSALTTGISVTYSGNEAGTATDGTDTLNFSEIERIELTEQADSVDARSTTQGIALDGKGGGDTLLGGSGSDTLTGGLGADSLRGDVGADSLDGGDGNDTLSGGSGNDFLDGGQGDDQIFNGSGNDTVFAGAGNDSVFASIGSDLIYGGAGDDSLAGGGLSTDGDTIFGEAGNDTLNGGLGNDVLDGGEGADLIQGEAQDDLLTGGAGADTLEGGDGSDTLSGGLDGDSLSGGADGDRFALLDDAGNDTITGGETTTTGTDFDTIDLSAVTSGVSVDWTGAETGSITYSTNTITFSEVEQIILTDLADSLDAGGEAAGINVDGGDGGDTLRGGSGDDTLTGGDGDRDFLEGRAGNDLIYGGAGQDAIVIYEDDGADTIDGGGTSNDATGDYLELHSSSSDGVSVTFAAIDGSGNYTYLGAGTGSGTFSNLEEIYTTTNDDLIDATAATSGENYVNARSGNDTMLGGAGVDLFDGGAGDDSLTGGDGDDFFWGSDGNDTLQGDAGDDTIRGDAGDDSITGGAGDDSLTGGDGADTFSFASGFGTDTVDGGAGGTDTDRLDFGASATAISVIYSMDEAGTLTQGPDSILFSEIEQITLSDSGDSVDASATTLGVGFSGAAGNDTLIGGSGGDTLAGGDGDDYIEGGAGDDFLTTGLGQDTLIGGEGNDTLMNSAGDDSLVGGAGDDSLVATAGYDTLEGGAGNDTLEGGTEDDRLVGGTGDDSMDGGDDADTFIIENSFGNDTIIGGEGVTSTSDFDTINMTAVTVPASVTYTGDEEGTITDGTDTITFSEIEKIILTGQDDTLDGSADGSGLDVDAGSGSDSIIGGAGDDTLLGGDGDDTLTAGNNSGAGDSLSGGAGDDVLTDSFLNATLEGGDGSDRINVGFGTATVDGGAGGTDQDTLSFATADDAATVLFSGDGAGTYTDDDGDSGTFTEIEALELTSGADSVDATSDTGGISVTSGAGDDTLIGGAGGDTLTGGDGRDSIEGGAGDDSIDGGLLRDTIFGGTGSDTIQGGGGHDVIDAGDDDDFVQGGAGADTISGGAGNDSLAGDGGGSGSDVVDGGAGDDTIDGGGGNDSLTGGDGDDVFIVSTGADTIADFNFGNTGALGDGDTTNNDFIDLSGYYDSLNEIRADQADDGILNQSNTLDDKGNAVDYSDNTQFGANSVTMQGASASSYSADNTGIVCFAEGTLIATPRGPVPVEDLRIGDMVMTRDAGPQRIRWTGVDNLDRQDLAKSEDVRPVLIPRGTLGARRDFMVSRQHGIFLGDRGFARAGHLVDCAPGIRIAQGKRMVSYFHLLLDQHQIIFAEDVPCESFFPGMMALKSLAPLDREHLFAVVPGLADCNNNAQVRRVFGPPAVRFLKRRRVEPSYRLWLRNAGGDGQRFLPAAVSTTTSASETYL